MPQLAVTAIGQDRLGIAAGLTGVLVAHDLDVADAKMGLVGGRFSLAAVVDAPAGVDQELLLGDLLHIGDDLGLDVVDLHELVDRPHVEARDASHVMTVYGIGSPEIVHAVSTGLARRRIAICDLSTKRVDGDRPGKQGLYAMVVEIAAPEGLGAEGLARVLDDLSVTHDLDIVLRPLIHEDEDSR